ncbi:hypothetical protein J6590_023255 [Homalodisca vitripennis]|nr:hypothetical protein J6590_023255 [Homalodisca vitripennis]
MIKISNDIYFSIEQHRLSVDNCRPDVDAIINSTVATDLLSEDRYYWRPQDKQPDAELVVSGLLHSSPESCVLGHRLGVSMVPAPNITSCPVISSGK